MSDLLPDPTTADVPLGDQIDEVDREIGMRVKVYKHLVATKKMKQAEADRRILRMRAVLVTLQKVRAANIVLL